ncbi:hypothetical protein B0H14DRAFT_2815351 [Mycena olivaceomarginata]|nr:hypothetical protein B0H14DRAFT_2815351 [Mycena olivaceomarginata]
MVLDAWRNIKRAASTGGFFAVILSNAGPSSGATTGHQSILIVALLSSSSTTFVLPFAMKASIGLPLFPSYFAVNARDFITSTSPKYAAS